MLESFLFIRNNTFLLVKGKPNLTVKKQNVFTKELSCLIIQHHNEMM
jgi:hypothetical protein